MPGRIHYFALPHLDVPRRYCGEWTEGDGWTVNSGSVTCIRCRQLNLEAERLLEWSSGREPILGAAAGGRVLVVDDDPDVRETLAELLESKGYAVATAADGAQALERLRSAGADVVLLDLWMPVVDGWTFLNVKQADAEIAHIPVIVASAAPAQALPGAANFVPKPFQLDQLLSAVSSLAQQHH